MEASAAGADGWGGGLDELELEVVSPEEFRQPALAPQPERSLAQPHGGAAASPADYRQYTTVFTNAKACPLRPWPASPSA